MASPSERTLGEPLVVVRLHDPRDRALDAGGARRFGGRWNSPGRDVAYASLSYACALLEVRVHANVRTPPPRAIAAITIPRGVRVAELDAADVPGWDRRDGVASRSAGDAWLAADRTAALIVPSRAGAPLERNIVLNLAHRDAKRLTVKSLGLVPWDLRLFERGTGVARSVPPSRRSPRRKK